MKAIAVIFGALGGMAVAGSCDCAPNELALVGAALLFASGALSVASLRLVRL